MSSSPCKGNSVFGGHPISHVSLPGTGPMASRVAAGDGGHLLARDSGAVPLLGCISCFSNTRHLKHIFFEKGGGI